MTVKGQTSEVKPAIRTTYSESDLKELFSGRKKLLELTDNLIEETFNRVSGDRFRVRDGDRERLAYLRTLVQLIALYDSLLKGSDSPPLEGLNRATILHREQKAKQLDSLFDF